jgi:hypothetical protein
MKVKIVPSEEITPKTLRAEDYVLSTVRVTVGEEVETDYEIKLDVETSDEAQSMLEEMTDTDLMALLRTGKKKDERVTDRWVKSAVAEEE